MTAVGCVAGELDAFEAVLRNLYSEPRSAHHVRSRFERAALDGLPGAVFELDCEGRLVSVNLAAGDFLGVDRPQDSLGLELATLLGPADASVLRVALARIVAHTSALGGSPALEGSGEQGRGQSAPGMGPQAGELVFSGPSGEPGAARARLAPLRDDGGRLFGVLLFTCSPVREPLSRRSLAADRDRQYLFDCSPLAAIEWDASFRIVRWSQRATAIFGWSEDEVLGKRFDEFGFVHAEELARVQMGASRLMHGEAIRTVRRNRNLRRDGRTVRCEWYNSVLRDASGQLLSVLSLVHDVSDAEGVKERLRASERRLGLALTAARMGTWSWELGRGLRRFDGRCARLLGYLPEDVEADEAFLEEHVHPEDLARVRAAREDHVLGRTAQFSVTLRVRTREQGWRWFLDRGQVVQRDAQGRPERSAGVLLDVHERQLFEAGLHREEKMQALGILAGGMAHDFNNALMSVLGYTELVQEDLPDDEPAQAHLAEVLRAAERASELIESVLVFAGRKQARLEPLDLQALLERAEPRLRDALPGSIALELRCEASATRIRGDERHLDSVLDNLVENAAHAMRDAPGRLSLHLSGHRLTRPEAERLRGMLPGPALRLRVEDSGCGMDEEIVARAFDPFFTTKPPGRGVGLGLSFAQGVLASHGGAIEVAGRPGEGSTVTLWFPLLPEESTASDPEPEAGGTESVRSRLGIPGARVLVVDDEVALADLSGRILTRYGYDVTISTSADEALAHLRDDAPYDLLVTDRRMPGKSGLELARAARVLCPDLPVVLVSGDSGHPTRAGELDCVAEVLPKPFGAADLAATAHRSLSGPRFAR